MSLRAVPSASIPAETARIAHAAFPKGTMCMLMRDTLGPLYTYCISRRSFFGGKQLRLL